MAVLHRVVSLVGSLVLAGCILNESFGPAGKAQGGSGGSGEHTPGPVCTPGEPTGQAPAVSAADSAWLTPAGGGAKPPTAQGGETPAEGDEVLAFSAIFLGDTDRDGVPNEEAWSGYGFDLDGWSSTPAQEYHCRAPQCSWVQYNRQDGQDGRDNSFGHLITSFVEAFVEHPSEKVSAPLLSGQQGLLLDVVGLGPAASYASLTGGLSTARGGDGSTPPTADWSSYEWHPVEGTRVPFVSAYLVDDVLVATFAQPLPLELVLAGQPWTITVHDARLTLDVHDRARGRDGTIAGIVWPEELVTAFQPVLGTLDPMLCGLDSRLGAVFADFIRKSADILVDGTQDPTRVCDGISIGLGFSVRASARGVSVGPGAWGEPCLSTP